MIQKRLLLIVAAVLAVVALYFWAALSWSYSSGERAGWVQKLSKKGWVCKTWEGELAMVSLPGAAPEKFYFTIRDDALAAQVTRAMGKRVTLHYEEKVGLPTTCFGDTRYFVSKIALVDEMVMPGTPAAPQPPAVVSPAVSPAASR